MCDDSLQLLVTLKQSSQNVLTFIYSFIIFIYVRMALVPVSQSGALM